MLVPSVVSTSACGLLPHVRLRLCVMRMYISFGAGVASASVIFAVFASAHLLTAFIACPFAAALAVARSILPLV